MSIFSLIFGKQYNILTHLPEAVLVIDDKGKILYANKRAFSLFETQKLRGKNINEYFLIDTDNIIKNKDEEIKQILKIVSEEQNNKITDVKVVDISNGKNKKYILTIIDNTQDHSLLDELITERQEHKILNHTKNVLLSKMSNFLISPLHSVAGFSQAMLEGLSGDLNDKQQKYIKIINSNSNELLLFLEKLTEMSEVESDIYKFEYTNFDILGLLTVVINEEASKLINRDVTMTTNTSDLLKQNCYTDKEVVKTVMTNLIENAINVIDTGAINISVSNPLPELIISKGFEIDNNTNEKSYFMFEINIKGIDASQYSNADIFDPYVQADKNSKKYMLQSILLGSSKKFINKLKGEIWINNEYANQVTFSFIIPVEKTLVE